MNKYARKMEEVGAGASIKNADGSPRVQSDEEVAAVEGIIGQSLPSDYAEFYRKYGGCMMWESGMFPVELNSGEIQHKYMDFFYGWAPPSPRDLIWAYTNYTDDWGVPKHLLPIGADEGNNLVCLAISGESRGCVYHWLSDEKILTHVANSFDEFMAVLQVARYDDARIVDQLA